MAEHQSVSQTIGTIKESATAVMSGVAELAGSQMKPARKHGIIGAGMFGGAGGLAWMMLKFLVFAGVFLAAWLWSKTGWSVLFDIFMGFSTMFVVCFVVAVVLGFLGLKQIKQVKAPLQAIDELKTTVADVGAAAGTGTAAAKNPPAPQLPAKTLAAAPAAHYVVDPIWAAKQRAAARAAAKAEAAVADA